MEWNVLEMGANGDGVSNDTQVLQTAIDQCAAQGGGRVTLPGGHIYRSGSLVLKNNVELYLESGARLKASPDENDFQTISPVSAVADEAGMTVPAYENCEYDGEPKRFFLMAQNAENIRISGFGVIDGSEEHFYGQEEGDYIEGTYYPRIPLLLFRCVSHLSVTGVTLTRSAFWTVHMVGCSDVLIDGIRILNNTRMVNCDGIDPDHCRNVRISNCHIESADDCIVFKNTRKYQPLGPCENIVVTNCTLTSTSAAIKFGTESESDFRNISVQNCVISDTNRGISMQLRDGGNIENVLFSNIQIRTRRFSEKWWGSAEPVSVTVLPRHTGSPVGCIRNVHFENINCDGENGIFLYAQENDALRDISFRRVRIVLRKTTEHPAGSWDLRPCEGNVVLPAKVNGFASIGGGDVRWDDVSVDCTDSMCPWFEKNFFIYGTR
jgi:polygalacturonase